ncbi:MAG: U32 family peptidase, partial [Butyrivibrio sp.]|nr:U32 family peptidase [Butyrivibrio sp.]
MGNCADISKKAEILAPAGSMEVFKAVLAAGADAVYLGGNRFGARAYAGNLSDSEILEAIDYAHLHGKKMYLTVNTLVKNSELGGLYGYLKPLYEAGLDAVIVQDYGVMRLVKEYFGGLDIHASTQMTITHKDYIDFLKKYNVTRIVPSRELSLEEIKRLHDYDGETELECFVHGALCYSYSGQCLISSFI